MVPEAMRNAVPQVPCCTVKATLLEVQPIYASCMAIGKSLETGSIPRLTMGVCVGRLPRNGRAVNETVKG